MKSNMGSTDRIIRILIAVIIGILYFASIVTGTVGIVLLSVAIIFVLTSFASFCPLYSLFRISTYKTKKTGAEP